MGHFMRREENPLRTEDLELKWHVHTKGETRSEWAPGNPVKTLNILIRGHFVLLFPDHEVALKNEGDFVLFGPDKEIFSLYLGARLDRAPFFASSSAISLPRVPT